MPAVGVMTPDSSFSVVVFPAPLGPRKATNSPSFDGQIDARHGVHFTVTAVQQSADGGPQTFPLLINPVGFRQAFDFDNSHAAGL